MTLLIPLVVSLLASGGCLAVTWLLLVLARRLGILAELRWPEVFAPGPLSTAQVADGQDQEPAEPRRAAGGR